jgi:hypothetical protein
MPLTAGDLNNLRAANSRFRAHLALFPAYVPALDLSKAVAGSTTGTLLTPRAIPMASPRYSTVANSGTVDITVNNSYIRTGSAATIDSVALDAGSSGTLSSLGGNVYRYTAPANGNGVAQINITVSGGAGAAKTGYAFVHYSRTQYDDCVGEIATISASLANHGWKMTMRVYGDASDFDLYKTVVLAVRDEWATTSTTYTESTFGGYQWPEGVFCGVITDLQYMEDGEGKTALAVEVSPTWWWLEKTKVGETWFGYTAAGGRFRLGGFAPVDAVWHFLNEIINWTQYFNTTLWYDVNIVDNLTIEESDLGTITEDVIGRTLGISYSDRYGSLFAIPDPDVRADEWWGTPASTYTLTPTEVMSYTINPTPGDVRKLTLEAIDASQLGIWAVSENASAVTGSNEKLPGRVICDSPVTLASWAVQKRAQMNRPWTLEVEQPLNHVMDLCNFADCIFTAPSQSGAPTASAQHWVSNITYRPDLRRGTWEGRTVYLPRTDGLGEAETGAVSGWGGSGQNWTGGLWYTGSALMGSGSGGWTTPPQGPNAWCFLFDFVNSGSGGFFATAPGELPPGTPVDNLGAYAAGYGWSSVRVVNLATPTQTGAGVYIVREFPSRVITQIQSWFTENTPTAGANKDMRIVDQNDAVLAASTDDNLLGDSSLRWTGTITAQSFKLYQFTDRTPEPGDETNRIASARVYGKGVNPFGGTGNCAP